MANRTRLLIVEDDEKIAAMLVEFFLLKEFDVDACSSGEEGWRSYLNHLPDVIILSAELPDISGIDLAERIQQSQKKRRVPLIVMADHKRQAGAFEAAGIQSEVLITKPFDLLALGRMIDDMLAHRAGELAVEIDSPERAMARLETQIQSLLGRSSWAVLKVAIVNLPLFKNALGEQAQEDLLAAVKDILQSIVSSCQDFGCQMLQQPIDDLFILVVPPGDVVPFTRIITKNLTRCFDYFYTPEQHKERLQVAVSGVQSSDKSTWDRAGLLAVLLQSNQ